MDEFESAMLDFLKFQHEEPKRLEEKPVKQEKKNGSTPAGYTKRTA